MTMTADEMAATARMEASDRETVRAWIAERDRNTRIKCIRVACRWQRMIDEKFAEYGLHPYEGE